MSIAPNLLIIDGLNILRRVYEASPAEDSPAKVDAALRSARSSFRRAIEEHQPTHAIAVFDFGGKTWHHGKYPPYKAHRKPMYSQLRDALPEFKDQLKGYLGLQSVAIEGYEADDVIATLASRWRARSDARAELLSTDKDLLQLLPLGLDVRDHFEGIWRDAAWVQRKFGVDPTQVCDFLALMGDINDGVPGVDGIGPKTAAKLLSEHGNLDRILVAAHTMQSKIGEKLVAQAEMARLSRELVTLKIDVQIGMAWNDMRIASIPSPRNNPVQRPSCQSQPVKDTPQMGMAF